MVGMAEGLAVGKTDGIELIDGEAEGTDVRQSTSFFGMPLWTCGGLTPFPLRCGAFPTIALLLDGAEIPFPLEGIPGGFGSFALHFFPFDSRLFF